MAGINTGRVIAGGLVGGVVANVVDMATGYLFMMDDMKANAARLHLDPAAMESTAGMISWVLVDFVYAILIVLTYAGIRPRFGPGPTTALYAGLLLYATVTAIMYGFLSMGMFTTTLFVKSALCALVSTALASVAGAAVYKE
jgi:hypothetical protein